MPFNQAMISYIVPKGRFCLTSYEYMPFYRANMWIPHIQIPSPYDYVFCNKEDFGTLKEVIVQEKVCVMEQRKTIN